MKRRFVVGAFCAIAIFAIVRALNTPVDLLGQRMATVFQNHSSEADFIFGTPWGLPSWILAIDNFVGVSLLMVAFLGGLPLGLAAFALRGPARAFAKRAPIARLFPYCLMFQVSSVLLASVTTTVGIFYGEAEYSFTLWLCYQAFTIAVGMAAIPVWGQLRRMTGSGLTVFAKPLN